MMLGPDFVRDVASLRVVVFGIFFRVMESDTEGSLCHRQQKKDLSAWWNVGSGDIGVFCVVRSPVFFLVV